MILIFLFSLAHTSPKVSYWDTTTTKDPRTSLTYNPWPSPSLIPFPTKFEASLGFFEVTKQTQISVPSEYVSFGEYFANDIKVLTGIEVSISQNEAAYNTISFAIDSTIPSDDTYTLTISKDGANVQSGTYKGLVLGSTTILQALVNNSLPFMDISDTSPFEYRGLMIDVARARHNVSMLYRYIDLCRFYKANYLHLHLTDDSGYTFPSKSHPEVVADFAYKREDLIGVQKYAEQRGIEIIGEIDMPCHGSEIVKGNTTLFGWPHNETIRVPINVLNPDAVKALQEFFMEVQEVFPSKYMHIGADECGFDFYTIESAAAMKAHNFTNPADLFRNFIMEMYDFAKSKGKILQLWEGFEKSNENSTKVEIPTDVVISPFDLFYYPPPDLIKKGYSIINACWTPLYVVPGIPVPVSQIYDWNPYLFGEFPGHKQYYQIPFGSTDLIIGSQLSMWQGDGNFTWYEVPMKLAAMLERTWNPTEYRTFEDFQTRYVSTNTKLMKLILNAEPRM